MGPQISSPYFFERTQNEEVYEDWANKLSTEVFSQLWIIMFLEKSPDTDALLHPVYECIQFTFQMLLRENFNNMTCHTWILISRNLKNIKRLVVSIRKIYITFLTQMHWLVIPRGRTRSHDYVTSGITL